MVNNLFFHSSSCCRKTMGAPMVPNMNITHTLAFLTPTGVDDLSQTGTTDFLGLYTFIGQGMQSCD